jgi:hypothetical protein
MRSFMLELLLGLLWDKWCGDVWSCGAVARESVHLLVLSGKLDEAAARVVKKIDDAKKRNFESGLVIRFDAVRPGS